MSGHPFRFLFLTLALWLVPIAPMTWAGTPPSKNTTTATAPSAKQKLRVASTGALVEFTAIGRPSLLKIHGTSTSNLVGNLELQQTRLSGTFRFTLSTLKTGIEKRDEHMKERYLEVEKYPESTLELKALEFQWEKESSFEGTLTLHGVSKPISGSVKLSQQNDPTMKISSDAHFKLRLEDFGIAIPHFAGVTVASEVELHVISTLETAL